MKKRIIIFSVLLAISFGLFVVVGQVKADDPCMGYCSSNEVCINGSCQNKTATNDPCMGYCSSDEVCINGSCQNKSSQSVGTTKTNGGPGVTLENPIPGGDIDTLIKNFITGILGLSGVLALVAFVFGGIYWLVSMGNPNQITKGRNIMLWAVLGLAVIFGSYAIITVVYNMLGIK